jgi:hypothetical protein
MALIGQYQRHPQLAAHGGRDDQPSDDQPSDDQPSDDQPSDDQPSDGQPSDDQPSDGQPSDDQPSDDQPSYDQASDDQPSEDATSASYTELPASYKPPPRRRPQPGRLERGRAAVPGGAGPGWRRWLGTHLAWAGWASVGAALIAVGVILGAALSSSSTPNATRPEQTVTQTLLPALPGGPPPAPGTACDSSFKVSSAPAALCMNEAAGDANTDFVVHGRGFVPHTSVTVTMTESGPPPTFTRVLDSTSSVRPVVGRDGTFSFTIKRLFPISLQLGLCTVDVTGSGGRHATTQFMVRP